MSLSISVCHIHSLTFYLLSIHCAKLPLNSLRASICGPSNPTLLLCLAGNVLQPVTKKNSISGLRHVGEKKMHVLHCCIACLKPNCQGNQFSAALTRLRRRDKGTTSELMATTAASGRPEHSKVKTAKVVKTRARCCRPVGDSARPGVLMDFPGTVNMKRQG